MRLPIRKIALDVHVCQEQEECIDHKEALARNLWLFGQERYDCDGLHKS